MPRSDLIKEMIEHKEVKSRPPLLLSTIQKSLILPSHSFRPNAVRIPHHHHRKMKKSFAFAYQIRCDILGSEGRDALALSLALFASYSRTLCSARSHLAA